MTTSTITPIPNAGSADFNSVLQTFLRDEDAKRTFNHFGSFTVSGGTHATAAGLVGTPSSLLAYPGGFHITETGSITYTDNKTNIWVFAHKDTTTAIGGNFVRIAGTHYIIESVSTTQPTTPTDTTPLMHVTTASGAITVVEDIRQLGPVSLNSRVGSVVQVVNVQDGQVATGATIIPFDNTIPMNTKGDEYMALEVTPTNASNKLKIDVVMHLANDGSGILNLVSALFQDSTANALAATMESKGTNEITVQRFTYFLTAGTTSPITFKVRSGCDKVGTTTFNGNVGLPRYGGVMASSITITEIAV